jgi:hypothetical protein
MNPPRMRGAWSTALGLVASSLLLFAAPAFGQQVRLTKLADASFGSITNLAVDVQRARSVCVYSTAAGKGYSVTATGSGSAGAFSLVSGAALMSYEVLWDDLSAQVTGGSLTPGVLLGGFTTTATVSNCASGPSTTATLIVLLRSTSLSKATAGSYTGSLTLVIRPE